MSGGNRYLLDDEFRDTLAAGAVNGTPATPGPGTRVAGAGGSIGSGAFTLSGAATDTLWNNVAVTRVFGQVLIIKPTITDVTQTIEFGWDDGTAGAIGIYALRITGDTIKPYIGGAAGPTVFVPADATAYSLAIVLRATGAYYFIKGGTATTWQLLWVGATLNTTPLYAGIANTNAAGTVDFLRGPLNTFSVPLLAYDTFTRANGALGSSEATGPDSQAVTPRAWTGATWAISTNAAVNTPATFGTDVIVNGAFAADTDWTKGTGWSIAAGVASADGTGAADDINQTVPPLTVNTWYEVAFDITVRNAGSVLPNIGTNRTDNVQTVQSYVMTMWANTTAAGIRSLSFNGSIDNVVFRSMTFSELISSITATHADVLADVSITSSNLLAHSGLVLRLDSAAAPANYLLVYIGGFNGSTVVRLDKCVAGVYTNLINATVTYSAGAVLRVIASGTSVSVFYNSIQVGTTQTVSDAGILNNTLHGLFSTSASNSLDSFSVFSRGTGGEYAALNQWSGANP